MPQQKTFQELFKRDRRCGDLVFAILFLLFALALLSQLGEQTPLSKKAKLFAHPSFWSAVGLGGMVLFGALHLLGSVLSPRIYGRLQEVTFWLRSLEYAVWFLVYVWLVPLMGYLPATLVFMPLLAFRVGYRGKKMLLMAAGIGVLIVVVFKSLLAVKIPGGVVYEYLPDAIRSFMLVNF